MNLQVPIHQITLRLTVGFDANGEPVRRALQQMTATDILLARTYYEEEAARLELRATSARDLLTKEVSYSASEAYSKLAHLLDGVWAVLMPSWRLQPDVKLATAIRQWWPDQQERSW